MSENAAWAYGIDWIAAHYTRANNVRDLFPDLEWIHVGAGHNGYKSRWVDSDYQIAAEGQHTNPGNGLHVTWSGIALENSIPEKWLSETDIIRRIDRLQGKVTRLDLRLDLYNTGVKPSDIKDDLASGRARTNATTWYIAEGQKDGALLGQTLYLGSRQSDVMYRIYDKGAEAGLKGVDILRVELEVKHERAPQAALIALTSGTAEAYRAINRERFFWDFSPWQDALFSHEQHHMPVISRPDPKTDKWLLGTVAPALAKRFSIDRRFKRRFGSELARLIAQFKEMSYGK